MAYTIADMRKILDEHWDEYEFTLGFDMALDIFEEYCKAFPETSFNPNHTAWQIFDKTKEEYTSRKEARDE
jgi:hypothetical protein